MYCPKCQEGRLRIEVLFSGTVDIEVDDDGEFEVTDSEPTDSEWTDESGVRCFECQWSGVIKDLLPAKTQAVRGANCANHEEG